MKIIMQRIIMAAIIIGLTISLPVLEGLDSEAFAKAEPKSCDHEWSAWEVIRAANCSDPGIKERECLLCGKVQDQTIPRTSHRWGAWEVVWKPTCSETGLKSRMCLNCGEEREKDIPKTAHKWKKWKVIKKPTAFKKGKKKRTCSRCDKVQRKAIPKRKLTKSEKKAKRVVVRYLNAAKHYKVKRMNKCFAKIPGKYGYPQKKIDGVFKKYNKKMKWKVKNISGGKKYKTVTAWIYLPDFYFPAHDAWYGSLKWAWKKWGVNSNTDSHIKRLLNRFWKKYKIKVKKQKRKYYTTTVKFKLVKKKGKWKIKTKNRLMVDIATAYLNEGKDEGANDFEDWVLLNY